MQKTTRLQRLLAVVVAVFMAVCCLPLNAFAADGENIQTCTYYVTQVDKDGNVIGAENEKVEFKINANGHLPVLMEVLALQKYFMFDGYKLASVRVNDSYDVDPAEGRVVYGTDQHLKIYFNAVETGDPDYATDYTIQYVDENGTKIADPMDLHITWKGETGPILMDYLRNNGAIQSIDGYTYAYVCAAGGSENSKYAEDSKAVVVTGGPYTLEVHYTTNSTAQNVAFSVRFVSDDGVIDDETKDASVPYDENGTIFDAWTFFQGTGSYKNYVALGYEMKNFVVPQPAGDVTYTGAGQFSITPDLNGKVVTVNLSKAEEPSTVEYVDFVIHFVSADGEIDVTKNASVSYDEYGTIFDAWTFFQGTGSYKNYAKEGYQMVNFVVPHDAGDATYTGAGQFSITPDLNGKVITVNLSKAEEPSKDREAVYTVNFVDENGNKIKDPVNVNMSWVDGQELFVLAQLDSTLKSVEGYTFKTLTAYNGTEPYDGDELVVEGKYSLTAHYTKIDLDRDTTYKINFVDQNNNIIRDPAVVTIGWVDGQDLYVLAQLESTLNGVEGNYSFDKLTAWNGTEAYKGDELVVPGSYELTAHYILGGKDCNSKYTIHFVDENNNEFMDPAVVNMAWVEGQELKLMTQLKSTLDSVSAKGYTFKTLTAWNGTEAYKGDELVVPGEYELIAHCVKNTSDSTGGDNNSNNNSNSNNNNTKTVSSNNNQVVKANAPADNTAKIMPQTGLSVETPVVFGVMMVAALAGAGAYLFAIRKKLN